MGSLIHTTAGYYRSGFRSVIMYETWLYRVTCSGLSSASESVSGVGPYRQLRLPWKSCMTSIWKETMSALSRGTFISSDIF